MKRTKTSAIIFLFAALSFFPGCSPNRSQQSFQSHWPQNMQRTWIGPEYWANRLQDWQIKNGRLENIFAGANRNVHILTRQLSPGTGDFEMSVKMGLTKKEAEGDEKNWLGFRIGAKGQFDDYRDSAIYGKGLDVGLTGDGELFIGDLKSSKPEQQKQLQSLITTNGLLLHIKTVTNKNLSTLHLSLINPNTDQTITSVSQDKISPDTFTGNLALVSHLPGVKNENRMVSWFSEWKISGNKITAEPDFSFGPILFSQYTLSKTTLKMTVQMPPICEKDGQTVRFQIRNNNNWETISVANIDKIARTATFRLENWQNQSAVPYRLAYGLFDGNQKLKEYYRQGTIRKEPMDKEEIVIAGFTGNNDLGFPNNDMVEHVKFHNPDFLFFSGDQIYERVAGFGVQRAPFDKACLDYLRKWYLYGWAYGDLMRDRPVIAIPDDHDVYHGNVWGAGGKATPKNLSGSPAQDMGGYKMYPEWVNMVQRTQTSHFPDPFDPTPVEQNIGVYYCDLNYGGISFAILEDRKFKSAPKVILPKAEVWNGWPQNKNFDAEKEADVKGAVLLGERQLEFLNTWAGDWRNKTDLKVVLSQTIFANVATLPEEEVSDANVPKLRILQKDDYPENDIPVSDMDSNGWPQTGRKKALKEMRKCFAFHLAGDQHLGSTIQYGIEDWQDAGFAFCVPAIANIWPRRWFPSNPGKNRKLNSPEYTGDFKDGFGNKITVHAVSNPVFTGKKPSNLYDRATGYGIVRINKKSRDIIIECWPRWVNPAQPGAQQYPGWPITINQMDNYNRTAAAYLPTIQVSGIDNPVVQVIEEKTEKIVYTIRSKGSSFSAKVFKAGLYTLKVGDPDKNNWQTFTGLTTITKNEKKTIEVTF